MKVNPAITAPTIILETMLFGSRISALPSAPTIPLVSELDWIMLPVANAEKSVPTANNTASHIHHLPRPSLMEYSTRIFCKLCNGDMLLLE